MSHPERPHMAGARLSDGTFLWVEAVPDELQQGATIRLLHSGLEETGTISIPARDVVYCDPDVSRGTFVASEPVDMRPEVLQPRPPLAVFESGLARPDGPSDDALLDLAWRERERFNPTETLEP